MGQGRTLAPPQPDPASASPSAIASSRQTTITWDNDSSRQSSSEGAEMNGAPHRIRIKRNVITCDNSRGGVLAHADEMRGVSSRSIIIRERAMLCIRNQRDQLTCLGKHVRRQRLLLENKQVLFLWFRRDDQPQSGPLPKPSGSSRLEPSSWYLRMPAGHEHRRRPGSKPLTTPSGAPQRMPAFHGSRPSPEDRRCLR